MSSGEFPSNGGVDAELRELLDEESVLRRKYDDEIRWLRDVATELCSREEQWHMKMRIDGLRRELVRLEVRIWHRKHAR
jgi:hypothetical protein